MMCKFKIIGILLCCITATWSTTTIARQSLHEVQPTVSPAKLSSWELSGALAAKNKKRGWTAVMNWLQQGANQYQIRLVGPLGGGSAIIEKRSNQITFRDGPKRFSSNNADELLQKKTGIRLPVKNLYYWVRGLPAPEAIQATQYDANHYLISFKQAGFIITYPSYTLVSGMHLPSKIRVEGNGLLIKLVIKRWRL